MYHLTPKKEEILKKLEALDMLYSSLNDKETQSIKNQLETLEENLLQELNTLDANSQLALNDFIKDPIKYITSNSYELRPYQIDILSKITNNEENTVNTWSRQSRKSHTVALAAIYQAIANEGTRTIIFTDNKNLVDGMHHIVKELLETLHIDFKNEYDKFSFDNNSSILIRSFSCSLVGISFPKTDNILFDDVNLSNQEILVEQLFEYSNGNKLKGHVHVFGTDTPIVGGFKHYKVTWRDYMDATTAQERLEKIGKTHFRSEFGN